LRMGDPRSVSLVPLVSAGSVKSAIVGSNQRAGDFRPASSRPARLGHLHRTPGAAQMTKTNAADTLSRKSVRTGRRSLILGARKLRRSCWRRRRKVQRSLFRKVPSSWNTPDIHSRSTIQSRSQQHLRKPRFGMRGDVPLGGLVAVLLGLQRWQTIAPHSFATTAARRAPQSILRPHR
jgi:hypothetical protein